MRSWNGFSERSWKSYYLMANKVDEGRVGWFGADGRNRARWDNWWRSWVLAIYFNSNERIRNLWTPPAAVSGNRIWLHLLHLSDRLSPPLPARRHEKQSNEIIFHAIPRDSVQSLGRASANWRELSTHLFSSPIAARQKRSPSFQISHFIYQHLATLIMKSIN